MLLCLAQNLIFRNATKYNNNSNIILSNIDIYRLSKLAMILQIFLHPPLVPFLICTFFAITHNTILNHSVLGLFMCIDKNNVCAFCCRDYAGEQHFIGDECTSDDCPSHDDLVAVLRNGSEMSFFCVVFNGEDYQAVFPESLADWSINFTTHADCKAYIVKLCHCLSVWSDFGSVPLDKNELIDHDWYIFPKGTTDFFILNWFESNYDVSIAKDLLFHTMIDLKVCVKLTYKIIFDENYYAGNQDLEKIVEPDFFSPANGYDVNDYKSIIDLPFVGSVLLDNGFQSVVRLT